MPKSFLVVMDGVIDNIIMSDEEYAEKIGAFPFYKGAEIGNRYFPPEVKAEKITDLSATCQQTIYDGLDIELSDGTTERYEYKALDQTNIKSMFDGVTNLGITQFPYQSEDGSCRVYSAADIITIYTSLEGLRISQLTYYHQLKEYVTTLATVEEIEAVTYGQPLTGDYLSHYNDMIAVAMEQMQQAIQRRVTANE